MRVQARIFWLSAFLICLVTCCVCIYSVAETFRPENKILTSIRIKSIESAPVILLSHISKSLFLVQYPRVLLCPSDWLDLDKVNGIAPELLNHTDWLSSLIAFRPDAPSVEREVRFRKESQKKRFNRCTFAQHYERENPKNSYKKWLEVLVRQNYTTLEHLLRDLSRDVEKCDCEVFQYET